MQHRTKGDALLASGRQYLDAVEELNEIFIENRKRTKALQG